MTTRMTHQLGATTAPAPPENLSARFGGVPLPSGLREDAENMSWSTFTTTYAPNTGPLRLGHWECVDPERPATRLGPQARNFRATLGFGDRIETATASASGPVAALTAMLHELGVPVEMLRFHQLPADPDSQDTTTFIRGSDGRHDAWGVGWSADPAESALRAVIACANLLLSAAA
jgi:hypothetical protein